MRRRVILSAIRCRSAPLNSAAILDRLMALHPRVIDLALDRLNRLLSRLGDPEEKLPPVIHVAGTNGKGSVLAFLRAMYEAAGYRVHVYTSPHLVRFHERIVLAGQTIGEDALAALLEECEAANGGAQITFFEITTAAAFLAFSRTPADVLLLETGLGGRYDATNVVPRPAATIITPVSMDHQGFLGDTLEAIAREKAGILKADTPCILARQARGAEKVIRAVAEKVGAPLLVEGPDWSLSHARGKTSFKFGETRADYPEPSLPGSHQYQNAGAALATVTAQETILPVPEAARALGLKSARWPGRLQRLSQGPLLDPLPEGWEVWLDGGHNPGAAKVLSGHFRKWRDKPLYMVFGHLANRDAGDFLGALGARPERLIAVPIPGDHAVTDPQTLVAAATAHGFTAAAAETVESAVNALVSDGLAPGRILICGSLYLVGSVLAKNGAENG
ncbi:MAG: bifunctional folylpolyglutamate synthase/dihydrofolate synthase [Magnetospiraceae bacterium]